MAPLVPRVTAVNPALLAAKETLVPRENPVPLVFNAPLAPLGKKESEEPEVNLDLLACLDPLASVADLEAVVSLALTVLLVPRVLLVNAVLLALLAPKGLLVKLVAPVKLACPVPRV